MIRYQAIAVVGYLLGTAWLVREMIVTGVDKDSPDPIEDSTTRVLAYTAFALVSWLPLALYFSWLLVRGVFFSVVLGFAKIAHHLRSLYLLHRAMRRGITILLCPCPECARRARG